MGIVVQKYGGSSVADTGRIQAVAQKVVATRSAGNDVVVVVSAMGGTTDELLDLAHQVSPDPDRRELDMLLSVGERISMTLLAMSIRALGHEAVSFTGSMSGIITNDDHSGARIVEVRPFRISDELARGRIVIVAGYQGVSYRREITTLGRGGSDTTAVALAAALHAEACEIYSDVDGVYSADPRVVPEARRLDGIGYEQMQELARCGARVLNAEAVEFARREGIALYARSSFGGESGTVVRTNPPDTQVRMVGVAGRKDVRLVSSADALPSVPAGVQLLASLPMPGGGSRALLIPGTTAYDAGDAVGTVSLVGEGAGRETEQFLAARSTLEAAGIVVSGAVATQCSVTLVVEPDAVDEASRILHAAFVT